MYDLQEKNDTDTNTWYRSVGIGLRNPDDLIRDHHYNTSYVGFKQDQMDVSYSIF